MKNQKNHFVKIFTIFVISLFFMQFGSAFVNAQSSSTSHVVDPTGKVNIHIIDEKGNYISEGTIIVSDLRNDFLIRERYSEVANLKLPYGRYRAQIFAENFEQETIEINVQRDESDLRVQLKQKSEIIIEEVGNLKINILDEKMQNVREGFVIILDNNYNFISREQFSNGIANIKLPYGKYVIQTSSNDYIQESQEIKIEQRENALRFILKQKTEIIEEDIGKVNLHIIDERGNEITEGFVIFLDSRDNFVKREIFRNGIAYLKLPYGRHKIQLYADSYEQITKEISVREKESSLRIILNKKSEIDKPLPQYGTFIAQIIDEYGRTIERATLTIYNVNTGKVVSSHSFFNGEARSVLSSGTYRIDISANGYQSHGMNLIITDGETIKQRLVLKKIIQIEDVYGKLDERLNLNLGSNAIFKNKDIIITYENFMPGICEVIHDSERRTDVYRDEIRNCYNQGLFEIKIKKEDKPIPITESLIIRSFSTDKRTYETGESVLFSATILNRDGSIALPEQGTFASLFIVQNLRGIQETQKYQMFYNENTRNYEFKIQATNENEFVAYIVVSRADNTITSNKINYFVRLPQISIPGDSEDRYVPRIMYWRGKVNQHWDLSEGAWKTDPDGVSGANLDKLEYCRKFYPNTIAVREYKYETTDTWRDRGNLGRYSSTKLSYECVQREHRPCMVIDCAEGYFPQYIGQDNNNCPIYECKKEKTTDVEVICYDSDGGLNYFEKGTTTAGILRSSDFCLNENRLREYACGSKHYDHFDTGFYRGINEVASDYGVDITPISIDRNGATFLILGERIKININEIYEHSSGIVIKVQSVKFDDPAKNSDSVSFLLKNKYYYSDNYFCENGCYNGACIKETNGNELYLNLRSVREIQYEQEFQVSWDSNGESCSAYGHHIPLKNGTLFGDLTNLPPRGSLTLIGRHANFGFMSFLLVGIQCFDKRGNDISKSLEIPMSNQEQPIARSTAEISTQSISERAVSEPLQLRAVEMPVSIDSTNRMPYNCILWFDGCNECRVLDNEIVGCTKRYCETYQKTECLQYKEEIKPELPIIVKPEEESFKVILSEGGSTRIGNYVLTLVRLSEEKSMIYLQESSKIIPTEDEYIYTCAPGCKEVPEGCLCPRIMIKINNGRYEVVSSEGNNYNIDSMRILPGNANIIAIQENNEFDITASNLEQGIKIEINQSGISREINIRTNDRELKTYIDENEFSASTRLTIESDVGNLYVLSDNEKKEIKILPSEASNKAKEVMDTLFDRIEIIERENRIVYEMESEKELRILGLIPKKADVKVTIDVEKGDVINVQKPWFASISTS